MRKLTSPSCESYVCLHGKINTKIEKNTYFHVKDLHISNENFHIKNVKKIV